MKARCSTAVLGALALLAQSSIARADGQITGVDLNLPAIKTCVSEMVTIKGTGQCRELMVDFGDGDIMHVVDIGRRPITFPVTFAHQYSKLGSPRVTVSSPQNPYNKCPGEASATVQVAAGPSITGLYLFENITPGGVVIVLGQNFGPNKGQMLLHLNYVNKFAQDVPLTIVNWSDEYAAGTIPSSGDSVSGALDQDTTVKVIAACGAVSNDFKVPFTAARDVVDLAYVSSNPPNHPSPWMQCGMSSGFGSIYPSDACQDQGGTNYPPECGCCAPWGVGPGSIGNLAGYHASGWGGIFGENGNDQFWANTPLNNGWVVESTSAEVTTSAGNGGSVSVNQGQTSPSDMTATTPTLGVDYKINNCGAAFYTGHIFITGPLGVPY